MHQIDRLGISRKRPRKPNLTVTPSTRSTSSLSRTTREVAHMPPKQRGSSLSPKRHSPESPAEQTVFVVAQGEDYEGSSVEGIFTTLVAAEDAVQELCNKSGRLPIPWTKDGALSWHRGCDNITIEEWSVDTTFQHWLAGRQ